MHKMWDWKEREVKSGCDTMLYAKELLLRAMFVIYQLNKCMYVELEWIQVFDLAFKS